HPQPARQHRDVGDEAHVVHQLVALAARVAAQHAQLALERDQAKHGLERGGLAGAVGADQADDAAGVDVEAGTIKRELVLVGLAQATCMHHGYGVDHGAHRASPCAWAWNSSSSESPRRWMRSSTSGHSSSRKRSRSLTSSFFAASSVTYMPRPLRFSTNASSASSW